MLIHHTFMICISYAILAFRSEANESTGVGEDQIFAALLCPPRPFPDVLHLLVFQCHLKVSPYSEALLIKMVGREGMGEGEIGHSLISLRQNGKGYNR